MDNNFINNIDNRNNKLIDNFYIINSKDRNAILDTNYNFSVIFSSNNNDLLTIDKTIKNIISLKFVNLILPNIYVDIKEILNLNYHSLLTSYQITENTNNSNNLRLERISDLPYLLLDISDFNNNYFGTNNEINKCTFVLKIDDSQDKTNNNNGDYIINSNNKFVEYGNINNSFVAKTDRKVLHFKDFDNITFDIKNNNLKNLKFTLKTPSGKILYNLNNYLKITNINLNVSNKYITISLLTYICGDEYNIGDKILFKHLDLQTTNNIKKIELINFLLKTEGHTIIKLVEEKSVDGNPKRIFKKICIPYEYEFDNITGISSINNNFTIDNSDNSINILPVDDTHKNLIINLSLQSCFIFKIVNKI